METSEGVADFAQQRFQARRRLIPEADAPAREYDSFVLAEWEYKRAAGDTDWQRTFFNPTNLGQPVPDLGVVGRRNEFHARPPYDDEPATRAQIVDALVTGVRDLGDEEQHGSAVRHYMASIDGERAATLLPDPLRSQFIAWEGDLVRRDIGVWLDDRGRLRKVSARPEPVHHRRGPLPRPHLTRCHPHIMPGRGSPRSPRDAAD